MLRRINTQNAVCNVNSMEKNTTYSISSTDEDSPREMTRHQNTYLDDKNNKEKSQLCKKFMQNGCCPYQKKCKFAHGSHELRKNHNLNSKYKTKQCGIFLSEGCCLFGDRCNFIHPNSETLKLKLESTYDSGFQEVRAECRVQSRLLNLLRGSN